MSLPDELRRLEALRPFRFTVTESRALLAAAARIESLEAELDAERALADRLGEALRLPRQTTADYQQIHDALVAWREARKS